MERTFSAWKFQFGNFGLPSKKSRFLRKFSVWENQGRNPLSQNFRLEFSKISLSNGTVISTRSRSMPARAKLSAKIQNGGYAIVLVRFQSLSLSTILR